MLRSLINDGILLEIVEIKLVPEKLLVLQRMIKHNITFLRDRSSGTFLLIPSSLFNEIASSDIGTGLVPTLHTC